MRLTKNQSLYLGIGTLVLFFGFASVQISRNATSRMAISTDPSGAPEGVVADPEVAQAPQNEEARFELKDFHRSETKDGKKLWEVTATRGEYFPASNSARIFDAVLFMFREDDNTMELHAGEALIYLSGSTLTKAETSKGVVLKYNNDGDLVTDNAVYDRENESVFAPGFVTITNDSMQVTGNSLKGDLRTNEFIIEENVKSILYPRSERENAKAQP